MAFDRSVRLYSNSFGLAKSKHLGVRLSSRSVVRTPPYRAITQTRSYSSFQDGCGSHLVLFIVITSCSIKFVCLFVFRLLLLLLSDFNAKARDGVRQCYIRIKQELKTLLVFSIHDSLFFVINGVRRRIRLVTALNKLS